MSKSEERRLAVQHEAHEVQPQSAPELKWRYACHGCTGVALKSSNAMTGVQITCAICGLTQVAVPENWLPL